MNLPYSANTAYAPNQPIKSVDLNAFQACIVGKKHGTVTLWLPVMTAGSLVSITWHPGWLQANADGASIGGFPIDGLAEGTLLQGLLARVFGAAAPGYIVATAFLNTATGTNPTFAQNTWVNPGAAWTTDALVLDGAYPNGHMMAVGETVTVTTTLAKNTMALAAIGIVISRP